jgi:hypothetical protein
MGTKKKFWPREGELTKQGIHTTTQRYAALVTKHRTIQEVTTHQTEQITCIEPTY